MIRSPVMLALLLVLGVASPCEAITGANVSLGHYYLQPNTPNQTIPIYVSGGAQVSGLNFNLQMGDGGPEVGGTPGPVFTSLDLTNNTIFQYDFSDPVDTGSVPQLLTWYVLTQNVGDHVTADGLLATATIDTSRIGRMEQNATNYWAIPSKHLGLLTSLAVSRDDQGLAEAQPTSRL